MKIAFIKQNIVFIIICATATAFYAYTTFNGIAYWQSDNVENNKQYMHTGGIHHVYGTGYYHK